MASPAANVVPLPARPDIAVRLDGVSKRFGEVTALHEGSLAVRRGELMTLLGPSGCGKTTLLNLVAGFLAPDSGGISIDGRLVTAVPTHKREIGMMFQSYALFPHMTVAANVGYGLKMRGLPKPEMARRVEEALALVSSPGSMAACRGSCPGGSSSGWRWLAPSSSDPRCCCSTSRSRRSTRTCAPPCRWS